MRPSGRRLLQAFVGRNTRQSLAETGWRRFHAKRDEVCRRQVHLLIRPSPSLALGALNLRTATLLTTSQYGPSGQVELRALNAAGQHEAVVSLFEGNRVANTQETLAEYVKALSRLDRLDPNRLYSLMQQVRTGVAALRGRSSVGFAQPWDPAATNM